jgi:hypothetical protein
MNPNIWYRREVKAALSLQDVPELPVLAICMKELPRCWVSRDDIHGELERIMRNAAAVFEGTRVLIEGVWRPIRL